MNNANSQLIKKGLFICFEGGEGSGKTTQIKLLSKKLSNSNIPFIITREPGGTMIGEEIRKILVSGKIEKLDSFSELLYFTAARRQHITEVIMPALKLGKIVISDRYVFSTMVYQGYVGGVNLNMIKELHQNFCFDLFPDLTILLDVDPNEGLNRKKYSNLNEDRFENFGLDFHNKVREEFLKLSKHYKNSFLVINANTNKLEISKAIENKINLFFTI